MKFQILTELINKLDQHRLISSDLMKTLAMQLICQGKTHTICFERLITLQRFTNIPSVAAYNLHTWKVSKK